MMRAFIVVLVSVCLSGCIFGRSGRPDKSPTIASLNKKTIEVAAEAPIQNPKEKAARSYRDLLNEDADPAMNFEARRRLADLQLEAQEEALLDADETGIQFETFAEAIRLYEELLKGYPNYERNDRIMYQLARAYENEGRAEDALAVLEKLRREHPDTPYLDEADFRRGEILFVNQRYREAEEAYQRVIEFGDASNYYEQSLYKHGWALFKQALHEESLASFLTLLDRRLIDNGDTTSVPVLEEMPRADRELIGDAFRVMSISLSYLPGNDVVAEFFAGKESRAYEYLVYEALGDLYLENERYTDAAETYASFPKANPNHIRAPRFQKKVIQSLDEGGFPTMVLDAKEDYASRFGLDQPFWNNHSPEDLPEDVEFLKTNLVDLAQHYHAEAQIGKAKTDYQKAAKWYRGYISYFPEDGKTPSMNFLLGEILFESNDYQGAAMEYERTAYAYPFHERSAEAGYASLLAATEHEKSLKGAAKAAWHRESIDKSVRFADSFQDHPESDQVLTKAAEDLFALSDFSQAALVSKKLTQREGADPKLKLVAYTVLGHSQFDQADFLKAEFAYVQALNLMPQDDEKREDMVERLASSIYKQGENAKNAGDLAAAVQNFARIKSVAPNSTVRPVADYDAAAAMIELQDFKNAAIALQEFRNNYPDHELAADVDSKLAFTYLASDQPEQAASELVNIARKTDDAVVKEDSLWQAAGLFEKAGNLGRTEQTLEYYVEAFPSPVEQATEARQRLADLTKKSGNVSRYNHWLDEIIRGDASAGSQRTDRTRYLAAKASLIRARPALDAYRGTRLTVPLKASLKVKKARLEEALAAYGKAADYGVAEVTTAATFSIGEIYSDFGSSLMNSDRPPELSAEELEQYDILLEEQAYPFEEKAIEIHEANVRRIADGSYDDWVKASLSRLAELVPARYNKAERSEKIVAAIQ